LCYRIIHAPSGVNNTSCPFIILNTGMYILLVHKYSTITANLLRNHKIRCCTAISLYINLISVLISIYSYKISSHRKLSISQLISYHNFIVNFFSLKFKIHCPNCLTSYAKRSPQALFPHILLSSKPHPVSSSTCLLSIHLQPFNQSNFSIYF
jgi:hypothetical protein